MSSPAGATDSAQCFECDAGKLVYRQTVRLGSTKIWLGYEEVGGVCVDIDVRLPFETILIHFAFCRNARVGGITVLNRSSVRTSR